MNWQDVEYFNRALRHLYGAASQTMDEREWEKRVVDACKALGRRAPENGEPFPVAFGKISEALEWANKRIKGLEWQIRDLCYEPCDDLDFPHKAFE